MEESPNQRYFIIIGGIFVFIILALYYKQHVANQLNYSDETVVKEVENTPPPVNQEHEAINQQLEAIRTAGTTSPPTPADIEKQLQAPPPKATPPPTEAEVQDLLEKLRNQ